MATPNLNSSVNTATAPKPEVNKSKSVMVAKYVSGRSNHTMLTETGTRIFFKNNVCFTANKEIIAYLDEQISLGVQGLQYAGQVDSEVINEEERLRQKIIAEYEALKQQQLAADLANPVTVTGMAFTDHVAN